MITLDADGETKRRYDGFVTFKYYRFANARIETYLDRVYQQSRKRADLPRSFDVIEEIQKGFMSEHGSRG